MYSFDFKSRLKQLNADLFVDDSKAVRVSGEFLASSLCSYVGKRKQKMGSYSLLAKDAREFMEANDAGAMAEFICAVPLNWVPEYDMFDLEKGTLLARGWRSIALLLHKKGFISSLDRARRVFQCPGLGTDEYDKLEFDQKLKWAKGFRTKKEDLFSNPLINWKP